MSTNTPEPSDYLFDAWPDEGNEPVEGIWWRADCYAYSSNAKFEKWVIERKTPKGRWIRPEGFEGRALPLPKVYRKWVPDSPKFVQRTKQEALEALFHRKRSYLWRAEMRLMEAREQFETAKRLSGLTLGPKRVPERDEIFEF